MTPEQLDEAKRLDAAEAQREEIARIKAWLKLVQALIAVENDTRVNTLALGQADALTLVAEKISRLEAGEDR